MKVKEKVLVCREPYVIRLLHLGVLVLWLGVMLFGLFTHGIFDPFAWSVWVVMAVVLPYAFPNIVIRENGIEVCSWNKNFLVTWTEIKRVRKTTINTRITLDRK